MQALKTKLYRPVKCSCWTHYAGWLHPVVHILQCITALNPVGVEKALTTKQMDWTSWDTMQVTSATMRWHTRKRCRRKSALHGTQRILRTAETRTRGARR